MCVFIYLFDKRGQKEHKNEEVKACRTSVGVASINTHTHTHTHTHIHADPLSVFLELLVRAPHKLLAKFHHK